MAKKKEWVSDNNTLLQTQGIRLTERQFKASLMATIFAGICSKPTTALDETMHLRLPVVNSLVNCILDSCILSILENPE